MNRKDIKKVLDDLTGDIDSIADKKAVAIIKVLINLVEILAEENAMLKETVQELKDEINRLKGEQGKPNIREQKKTETALRIVLISHRRMNVRNAAEKKRENQKIKKNKPFVLTGALSLNLIHPRCLTMQLSKDMSLGSYKI